MQLKKAIKSTLLPVMESNGFTLIDSATAYFEYGISDDSLRIIVDKNPWPPAELRVKLYYRDYCGSFSHFDLNQLIDYRDLDLSYNNQEELETKLGIITSILETYAFSLLIGIRDNHVFWRKEMDMPLSDNPENQAINYAETNLLTLSFALDSFLFLENRITVMRGEKIFNWRHNFEKHTNEIIGLTSYYGEIIRREYNAKWESGMLEYDQGSGYPKSDVIDYWNYGLYMPAFRLVHPSLRWCGFLGG